MNYDLEQGVTEVIASEAFRRVAAEMGEAAASSINLQGWSSGASKESFLMNLKLINPETTAARAQKIQNPEVVYTHGTTTLSGIIARVNEGNLIALAQVGQVLDEAEETEHQKGAKVVTVAEAIRIVECGASETGYKSYRKLYPGDRIDGTRNPSLAGHLGQAVRWISRFVQVQDSYVDGSARRGIASGNTAS